MHDFPQGWHKVCTAKQVLLLGLRGWQFEFQRWRSSLGTTSFAYTGESDSIEVILAKRDLQEIQLFLALGKLKSSDVHPVYRSSTGVWVYVSYHGRRHIHDLNDISVSDGNYHYEYKLLANRSVRFKPLQCIVWAVLLAKDMAACGESQSL